MFTKIIEVIMKKALKVKLTAFNIDLNYNFNLPAINMRINAQKHHIQLTLKYIRLKYISVNSEVHFN